MTTTPSSLPYSAACERNQAAILDKLTPYLKDKNHVLEIGSGTGQHGQYFCQALPHIQWQLADQAPFLDGLKQRHSAAQLSNLLAPSAIDVNSDVWQTGQGNYHAIYTANTLHIMDKITGENMLNKASDYLIEDGLLFIYGPFKYNSKFTSHSNQAFDASLKARQFGDGIKDIEWVEKTLSQQGFTLIQDWTMPANNQLLVFINNN